MLSDKLKALRCEQGLSQEELAVRLNVVRQTVSKWEQGSSQPDAEMLTRLAKELNVSVSALLTQDAEPPKDRSAVLPKQSNSVLSTVLLIVGAPLWVPLVIAGAVVCLALYVSLWAVIVSLWASFGALVGGVVGGVAGGALFICTNSVPAGCALISAALVCAGLSIFLFFGCKAARKGAVWLAKTIVAAVWRLFTKKEGAA